jgi:hypothetical protein
MRFYVLKPQGTHNARERTEGILVKLKFDVDWPNLSVIGCTGTTVKPRLRLWGGRLSEANLKCAALLYMGSRWQINQLPHFDGYLSRIFNIT